MPDTPLLQWLKDNNQPITKCAQIWKVSTLWLIAHGQVRAGWDNARKIERHTGGAVTVEQLCKPLPKRVRAARAAARAARDGKTSTTAKPKPKPRSKTKAKSRGRKAATS